MNIQLLIKRMVQFFAILFVLMPLSVFAQAGNLQIDNLEINMGSYKIKVPKGEITGTSLTKADIKNIFDTNSKISFFERMSKLTFNEAIIPEIIMDDKWANHDAHTIYKNIKLSNVVAGRIGHYVVEEMIQKGIIDDKKINTTVDGVIKNSIGDGLDLAASAKFITDSALDDNAPFLSLHEASSYESMRYEIGFSTGKLVYSTGLVKLGAIKGRVGKISLTSFIEAIKEMQNQSVVQGHFDNVSVDEKVKIISGYVQFLSNIQFGGMEIENMAINGEISETKIEQEPAIISKPKSKNSKPKKKLETKKPIEVEKSITVQTKFSAQIAHMKMGIDESNFHLDGVEISAPDAKVNIKLASYNLKGYSFAPTLAAARAFIMAGKFEPENLAQIDFRDFIPLLGVAQINGLKIELPYAKKDSGSLIKIGIAEFFEQYYNQVKGIPTAVKSYMKNITLDLPDLPLGMDNDNGLSFFRMNGIDKVDVTYNLDAKWNEPTKDFTINDFSISGVKLGTIKFTGAIGNIPRELFTGSLSTAQILAFGFTAKLVQVQLVNDGLMELMFKSDAFLEGKSEFEARNQLLSDFKTEITKTLGENEKTTTIVDGFAKFLNHGKSFSISAKPKLSPDRSLDGIGAMDIFLSKDAKEVLDKVDIDVKVE